MQEAATLVQNTGIVSPSVLHAGPPPRVSGDSAPRVLWVDAEPNALEGLRPHLERVYSLRMATSSLEALSILDQEAPYAVVLSDIRMPEMDGATFLARVRQRFPDTVRLLLTGAGDVDLAIAGVNEGHISQLLTKPCLPAQLLAALSTSVEHYRLAIAERILRERTLLATRRLEAVNRELEAFTYSVSHDLRAPLRAIDGFIGILLKEHSESLNTEGRRVLDIVRKNAAKMSHLIDDLLAFSRLGRKPLVVRRVDMARLAESAVSEVQLAAPGRRWEVRVNPLPEAHGDEALLQQVWSNLASNASKYSSGQATTVLEIGGRQENGERIYYVKDNGVDFDMQYAGKLFQVFSRLHKASEFEGTGIGLALVYRIISRHGGRVWAEGSPGQGATFYFALPEIWEKEDFLNAASE
jgi:two-component system, sensor histidine kinase and response regulator